MRTYNHSMTDHDDQERATFTAMSESTQADWMKIAAAANAFNGDLANRVLTHLKMLQGRLRRIFR